MWTYTAVPWGFLGRTALVAGPPDRSVPRVTNLTDGVPMVRPVITTGNGSEGRPPTIARVWQRSTVDCGQYSACYCSSFSLRRWGPE